MRETVMKLLDIFGHQHNHDIQRYLGQQYVRCSRYKGVEFTLRDVSESVVSHSIKSVCAELGLGANTLLHNTMIRPFINTRGDFAALVELTSDFYAGLLSSVVKTIKAELFYPGDSVEYRGKNQHVLLKRKRGKRKGASEGGFINITTTDGDTASVLMDKAQWAQACSDYIDIKLNGTEFEDPAWLEQAQKCFLFHRLIDEFIGAQLEDADPECYALYRNAVAYQQRFYNVTVQANTDVYSHRGYRIGRAVKLFDSVDVKAAKSKSEEIVEKRADLKVVVNNTTTSSQLTQSDNLETDESFSEWGTF